MPKFSVYIEISKKLKSMAISVKNFLLRFPDSICHKIGNMRCGLWTTIKMPEIKIAILLARPSSINNMGINLLSFGHKTQI